MSTPDGPSLHTRIGLIGPAQGDLNLLRKAAELMVVKLGVDRTIYLGTDNAMTQVVKRWANEILDGSAEQDVFLTRAMAMTKDGTPAAIHALLEADHALDRLTTIRTVEEPPKQAIEMLDDRIVIVVYDKAVLEKDDIANAHIVVYGFSKTALLKQFGPRAFFTPGLLSGGQLGVLSVDTAGTVTIETFTPAGQKTTQQQLNTRGSKLTVTA